MTRAPGERDLGNVAAPHAEANGSMDAVRDLLFGRRFQEIENKVDALEHRLLAESANLQSTMARRLELFEEEIRAGLEGLDSRLSSERLKREEACEGLRTEIRGVGSSFMRLESDQSRLNRVVAETSEHLAQDINRVFEDCQNDILSRGREMRNEVDSIRSHLISLIDQLQEASVERSALSSIFVELGKGLASSGSGSSDAMSVAAGVHGTGEERGQWEALGERDAT